MIHGVKQSRNADDILSNLMNLHELAQGSDAEQKFHRERIKNATHHVAFRDNDGWIFAPVKWCGARKNSIRSYPGNKGPYTEQFKPIIINAGFSPLYSHEDGYDALYESYVHYCAQYGFVHSETEDSRTFYLREFDARQIAGKLPANDAVLMNLNNLTSVDDCYITRVWGFSPEDWGALGFPKKGTARRWAEGGSRYFVICFVSHHKAAHIADGDEGLVHGVYELTDEVVDLVNDDVLAPSHFDNPNHFVEERFRWPVGLRAVRAWRFLNPPMTKAALPDARSKSWDVSTNIVPISKIDFDLLCQYKMEQVPVYGQDFKKQRLAGPVAVPCHVYLFACENEKLLSRMPRWRKGDVLVKIGCTSDVQGRLASFNDDPLSCLFDFSLSHMINDLVGEDKARSREIELLAEVREIGRSATERMSEFFFIDARQLGFIIAKFGKINKVA